MNLRPSFTDTKTTLRADFDAIRISLASPDKIEQWSFGEVTKPETINYRTFKPERDGLFCAKIFGPITDWECLCGKYKRMKHRGVICDKCGVEVTQAKVRRERLGHIKLATPVSHVWFFKGLPSRIGHLLDISLRDLERVLYFEAYVVVDPGETKLVQNQLLTEDQFRKAREEHGYSKFKAQMGAEAIKELLKRVNVDKLAAEMREKMRTETSAQKKLKHAKRLKVVDAFRKSSNKPEWMILDVVPVIPPELRPLVPLDGGRFATSDLNDLYRRVINRNNRLKKLMELKAPDVIIRNEKRMLQEAVDALFDNGRRGRVLRGANNRPLKSLSDTLKGKQGRFRQNLLGKRVDYSGRSVIVVGPELKLHQCGLPKKMALELFKPFIYNKLEERGLVATIKQAKEMVEKQVPEVWDVLEEVIREHPVLLNRAPTLHRLGIQAFEPVLVEGKAIRIHPLVCTAFNADFDGDQMAVHIPLSPEAQIEASTLMMSSKNILSPSERHAGRGAVAGHRARLLLPDQGEAGREGRRPRVRVHGRRHPGARSRRSGNADADSSALHRRAEGHGRRRVTIRTCSTPKCRMVENKIINTTVGRVILNSALPTSIPFVNGMLKKKGLQQLVQSCYLTTGLAEHRPDARRPQAGGLHLRHPLGHVDRHPGPDHSAGARRAVRERPANEVIKVEQQYLEGAITNGERYNKVIAVWSEVTEKIADAMFKEMERRDKEGKFNPVYIMADSGARGSKQQIRQLAGMRGLMAKPSGEIIETADQGELPRRPVGARVLHLDARRAQGSGRHRAEDRRLGLPDAPSRRRGAGRDRVGSRLRHARRHRGAGDRRMRRSHRAAARPHHRPRLAREDHRPDQGRRDSRLQPGDRRRARRRSAGRRHREGQDPLGADLRVTPRRLQALLRPRPGDRQAGRARPGGRRRRRAVDRRARHAADDAHVPHRRHGVAYFGSESTLDSKHKGVAKYDNLQIVERPNAQGGSDMIVMNRNGFIVVQDDKGRDRERYQVVYGARLKVKDGQPVENGQILVEWDPYTFSILTEEAGQIKFKDIIDGVTVQEDLDEVTGLSRLIVVDSPDEKKQPTVEIKAANGNTIRRYIMPVSAHLMVPDGDMVNAGDVLAKIPRETTKTKDITGGLPRVVELFEARKPKDPAVISEIDGTVKYGGVVKGQRKILIVAGRPERRAARIQHPARRARQRPGRRPRARGRPADGRPVEPARHSARARREGAAEVPGERNPGGLPPAGREHQRQAHRGDHAPDDALGPRRGRRRHGIPGRRAGGQVPLHGRERARHRQRRPPGHRAAAAARYHQGVAVDRVVHLGGVVPGDHARPHRGGDLREDRLPARPEGERDDGTA